MGIILTYYIFTSNRENKSQDIEKKISYGDLYTKKLINTILENLSIICNNIIIKLIEEDMVIRLDIKTIILSPTNDNNWKINVIVNNVTGKICACLKTSNII